MSLRAGGTLVDAPILGAPPVVRAGEAAILVGGAAQDVADVRSVLSVFGSVRHVGPLGSAARPKLVANSMIADVILAAAELQVAGEDAGLDPEDVFFVLARVAPSLQPRKAGLEGYDTPRLFALRDLRKDVDLAMSLYGASATQRGRAALPAGSPSGSGRSVANGGRGRDHHLGTWLRPRRSGRWADPEGRLLRAVDVARSSNAEAIVLAADMFAGLALIGAAFVLLDRDPGRRR